MIDLTSFNSLKRNQDGTVTYTITIPKNKEIIRAFSNVPMNKKFKLFVENGQSSGDYVLDINDNPEDAKLFDAETMLNKLKTIKLANKPINQYGLIIDKNKNVYVHVYFMNVTEPFNLSITVF